MLADNPILVGTGVFILLLVAFLVLVRYLPLFQKFLPRRNLNFNLSQLTELRGAFANTPPHLEELAETAYIESARLLEMDYFQVGLFENDLYRTLFWLKDGKKIENQSYQLSNREGLYRWLKNSGQSLVVSDFEAEASSLPAKPSYASDDPPASGIYVPLLVGEEVIGVISVQSRKRNAFGEEELQILEVVGHSLASPLGVTLLNTEVNFLRVQIQRDEEIAQHLITPNSLKNRTQEILGLARRAFDYHAIAAYQMKEGAFDLFAYLPQDSSLSSIDHELLSEALAMQQPQSRQHTLDNDTNIEDDQEHFRIAELAIPILHGTKALGAVQILQRGSTRFSFEQQSQAKLIAANLGLALLEDEVNMRQQEENWITTVLLEVAKHAAQPGDTEKALQSVLQLTILLSETHWAGLLVVDGPNNILRVGPSAGLGRQTQARLADLRITLNDLGLPLASSGRGPVEIVLPDILANPLATKDVTVLQLGSAEEFHGLFVLEGTGLTGRHAALMGGIANQIALRLENYRLVEEVAARRSLERELDTARSIQESFLPKSIPHFTGWELGVNWKVAQQVGGDFYDFIPLNTNQGETTKWGIVIADVTDHGIPAALYMALCRTLLRSVAINRADPGETLTRLNQLLFSDTHTELLVSLFYAVWEPETANLSYANAGHNPPLMFQQYHPARLLSEHDIVLGADLNASYTTHNLTIQPGELIVLYTDGITEATDEDGEMFGLHRLENLVLGMRKWTSQALADRIPKRVADFCGTQELSDDLTTVVIYRPDQE